MQGASPRFAPSFFMDKHYSKTKQWYSENANAYFKNSANSLSRELQFFNLYLPEVKVSDDNAVLDVGAGAGQHSAFFRAQGYKVFSIDFSRGMKKFAEKKYGLKNYYVRDILVGNFDFLKNEKLCAIWASSVLTHIKPRDFDRFFAVLWTYLGKKGKLGIIVPWGKYNNFSLKKNDIPFNYFSLHWIKTTLRANNFNILHANTFQLHNYKWIFVIAEKN